MRKEEQKAINQEVENAINVYNSKGFNLGKANQIDYCQAWYYDTPDYMVLRSYNTIIAIFEKSSNTLYDFLRYVYGYTATSAKHISKFRHYCHCIHEKTWRAV